LTNGKLRLKKISNISGEIVTEKNVSLDFHAKLIEKVKNLSNLPTAEPILKIYVMDTNPYKLT